MTSFLITGANGMLGRDLQAALVGRDVTALGRADLDVTDADACLTAVAGHDVVINAAAYTKVDDAETNQDEAYRINATGPLHLAVACSASPRQPRLIQISTDYVFDGASSRPYNEDAPINPQSAYGRTKAAGERAALLDASLGGTYIVRTAWLYGEHGPNFARTMLRLAAERDTVEVVTDQVGQPTWTRDLAHAIIELADSDAPAGIYHATNAGEASWFDFAREVFKLGGYDPDKVKPTDSSHFVRPAPRPSYSVLGSDSWRAANLTPLRDWREALQAAFSTGALVAK